MAEPTARHPRSHATLGDIIAAALLAFGALAENRRGRERHGYRAWLTAVPIVLVNFVAFYGQFSYFQAHRHPVPGVIIPPAVSVVVALALESMAVYLAWSAHVARLKGDTALRLRLGSYLTGLGIGVLNYSHFCRPGWRPDTFAVACGVASVASPLLWGIYSNRESRDDLKAQDQIEDHGVRLGFTRSFYHPLRSFLVRSRAAWTAENRPAEAIKLVKPPKWMRPRDLAPAASPGEVTPRPSAPQAPPSAPRTREPRQAADRRAARKPELTAARPASLARLSEAEQAVALDLMGAEKLPGRDKLARTDPRLEGRRRSAWRVLQTVQAGRNGGGSHGVDDQPS
jgi:hypothetical protein